MTKQNDGWKKSQQKSALPELRPSHDMRYGSSEKRRNGRYYTTRNPFNHPAFTNWAETAGLPDKHVLEPFAGANSLITYLTGMGLCSASTSYDIQPVVPEVEYRDTIADFPSGYEVCVTNPPWLAKNSATFRGIAFPDIPFDDLYKAALYQCLRNCAYVAALVPESFIRAKLFTERLTAFVSLTTGIFNDTGHPVGLALFSEAGHPEGTFVWSGRRPVGYLPALEMIRPRPTDGGPSVKFNQTDGNVGFIGLDNNLRASIRFCEVSELDGYKVKKTGRHITKLAVDSAIKINEWNRFINRFREETQDVLMTAYKGIRLDGMYRRRLDWETARGVIHNA